MPTRKDYNFGFQTLAGDSDRYQVDFIDPKGMLLTNGGTVTSESRLFAGAKKVALLDYYADQLNIPNFDLAIDFGWFYFQQKPFMR